MSLNDGHENTSQCLFKFFPKFLVVLVFITAVEEHTRTLAETRLPLQNGCSIGLSYSFAAKMVLPLWRFPVLLSLQQRAC